MCCFVPPAAKGCDRSTEYVRRRTRVHMAHCRAVETTNYRLTLPPVEEWIRTNCLRSEARFGQYAAHYRSCTTWASSISIKSTRAPTTLSTKNLSSTVVCGKCSLPRIAADRHLMVNPDGSGLCTVNESPHWRIPDSKNITSARSVLVAFGRFVGCAVPPRIAAPDDCREPERASNLNIVMQADGFVCEIANVICIVFLPLRY
jgi:hypothetical protein